MSTFVANIAGQSVDFDGAHGAQCVDLMRYYVSDILGISNQYTILSSAGGGGARNIFDNATTTATFTKIAYSGNEVPQEGDIIFWNSNAGGGYGHVAIVISATRDEFISFDQNWPVGSAPQRVNHDYTNVSGWLRPN
jgi:N-acetylmuramoyl-L-alanine amidase